MVLVSPRWSVFRCALLLLAQYIALLAVTATTFARPDSIQRVPELADCRARRCREGSKHVFSVRHWLKVRWIDAASVPAKVVQLHAIGDAPARFHEYEPMSSHRSATLCTRHAISIGGNRTDPIPASCSFIYFVRHSETSNWSPLLSRGGHTGRNALLLAPTNRLCLARLQNSGLMLANRVLPLLGMAPALGRDGGIKTLAPWLS